MFQAGMAELADAADSKSAEVHPSWGFDSPSRHQPPNNQSLTLGLLERPGRAPVKNF